MPVAIDITGRTFGRLVVVRLVARGRHRRWLVRCACGTSKEVIAQSLLQGRSTSCGCGRNSPTARAANRASKLRHGATGSPTYSTWKAMHKRCSNPRAAGYANWGGRGIRVCARWGMFENFLADMGEKPPGTSLDRVDNDGNYEPGNCRWATSAEQATNRRPRRAS